MEVPTAQSRDSTSPDGLATPSPRDHTMPKRPAGESTLIDDINVEYQKVRKGNYSKNPDIDVARMTEGLQEAWDFSIANPRFQHVVAGASRPLDGVSPWMNRSSIDVALGDFAGAVRGSMNIYISAEILKELDTILTRTELGFGYKFGNPVHPSSLARHDTVTFYFASQPSPETLLALAQFAEKHARKPEGSSDWDDCLLGKNIVVDGHRYRGFTVDKSGTVKEAHVQALLTTLMEVSPSHGQGIKAYLDQGKGDDAKQSFGVSSGMLHAITRALDKHGIRLDYDPTLSGFTVTLQPNDTVTAPRKIQTMGERYDTFDALVDTYYRCFTGQVLESIFLGKLPLKSGEAKELLQSLKAQIRPEDVKDLWNIPDDHPLSKHLTLLEDHQHRPNIVLLLEFARSYASEFVVQANINTALAEDFFNSKIFEIFSSKGIEYHRSDAFGTAIEVNEYTLKTTKRFGNNLQILNPEEMTFNLLQGLAIAYQEKVHGLLYPHADFATFSTPLTPAQEDLKLEMDLRAQLLAYRESESPTTGEFTQSIHFFNSPLFPIDKEVSENWTDEHKVLFLQRMRERFGERAREVGQETSEYQEIVSAVNAQVTHLDF